MKDQAKERPDGRIPAGGKRAYEKVMNRDEGSRMEIKTKKPKRTAKSGLCVKCGRVFPIEELMDSACASCSTSS